MKTLVIFNKQKGEIVNAYSLVDSQTLKTIPQEIIYKTKKVEDRLYSSEELSIIRDELCR